MFHEPFAKSRERHRHLNRGAGLETATQSEWLVHHRKNPAGGRIDHNHGAIQRSKGIDSSFSDRQVFAVDFLPRPTVFAGPLRVRAFVRVR